MLRVVLAALLLTGTMAAVARPRLDGLAPPSPGAAVTFGNARITLLTENLYRFEYSATGVFDDRATLTVINRQLPVPTYKTSNPSPQSVSIDIGDVVITYTTPAKPPPVRSIGASASGRDALNAVRSALYPNGLYAGSYQECGNYCLVDSTCSAFVWDTSATDPTNCWPLCSMTGNYSNSARVLTLIANATNGTCTAPPSPFFGNLQITSTNPTAPFKWRPGQAPTGNLLGTYSSLDCYSNPATCYTQYMSALNTSYGLLSTQGWSVVDDTATMRFAPPPAGSEYPNMTWWTQTSMVDAADFYFLAHGLNFKSALADFASISGAIALPPRAAFGPWWSRYWPYTAQTIVSEVLSGYANYSIPLTTLVLDMDWHNEPTTNGCQSWGNYDWNLSYFPDPVAFSEWVHSPDNVVGYPLKMALNVHPQTGVDHCDLRYSQIATKMGVNPATNQTVQCNFANVTFTQAVFDVYFDASPLRLNDVWWTDYGGCGGANSLLWSNYVFDSYPGSLQSNRPLVLSRNGGLGGQRYPIGFSGDTFQHEITLDFEIQTTPMAANVLFAYWSHDIGGFHNGTGCPGDADPTNYTGSELLLRWVQFGAVAPIMRTHCDHCERRIWMFYSHFPEMLDAFRLRNALMPYLYTEAYTAYQTALAPIRSMYIEWPTQAGAYAANHQFFVGSQIIAAPISNILPEGVNTTTKTVWMPPGEWVSWDNTVVNSVSTFRTDTYSLAQIPLWVSQWTILPLKGPAVSDFQSTQPAIMWTLWPGANTLGLEPKYTLFEDDGVSLAYQTDGGAFTVASYTGGLNASTIVLTISATTGKFNGQLPTREHLVQVRGYGPTPPEGVVVNGSLLPSTSYYIIPASSSSLVEAPLALYINAGTYPINKPVTITISRTEVSASRQ